MPLEFICVVTGTADHESLVRTTAAPSAVHAGLLALGIEPGRPLTWNQAAERYTPPSGPPMTVSLEWTENGELRRERVGRLLKSLETGNARRPQPFVFVGSTMYDTGDGGQMYAADATGQIVSLVNFESPVVDVPALKSNDNATLEWVIDFDAAPRPGTPVMLVLTPIAAEPEDDASDDAAGDEPAPTSQPAGDRLDELRAQWEARVLPQGAALREAAQTHYEVMQAYQDEINRLLDEADALRREMDKLQERYNELTTPQPTRE
ncbi:MAG: YdjY domain-containing protein [Planctomycetota bacterium]